jgi:hypothetical protein
MQPYEIRQLPDGSIDYNQYYARPVSLLTPAMRRFCRRSRSLKILAITAAAVATIVAAASIHRTECTHCTSASIPADQLNWIVASHRPFGRVMEQGIDVRPLEGRISQ